MTVCNVGPTGNLNVLFPDADDDVARPAAVAADRPLHILDVVLTPPTGPERLFALWSRTPLPLRLPELQELAEQGRVSATESHLRQRPT